MSDPPARPWPTIDPRLIQWIATRLVADARAKLVDGGADGDRRIDLADVFIDLHASIAHGRANRDVKVVSLLCGGVSEEPEGDSCGDRIGRRLIVGGAGTGKSTLTTMTAQLLRMPWVERQLDTVGEAQREEVSRTLRGLRALKIAPRDAVLPVRVSLPDLARWMSTRVAESTRGKLWEFLATSFVADLRAVGVSVECTAIEMENLLRGVGTLLWIFDGLDEVPRSAGRDVVIAAAREALTGRGELDDVVVTTRPQGYLGEFDDLDALELVAMERREAQTYGQRLLRAWQGAPEHEHLAALAEALQRPEVAALARSPLHATIAVLFIANEDELPRARSMLFERYFDVIFKRELKKLAASGISATDRLRVRELHARFGLALHVRSQSQGGARALLTGREVREIITGFYREQGSSDERARDQGDAMMRFASERLVLLLRSTEGGYTFGIRSLQEFFASVALRHPDAEVVRARLESIGCSPHWSNVVALFASGAVVESVSPAECARTRDLLVGLCRALNEGRVGGDVAAHCFLGARLAIALLRETERYAGPWLHKALWELARTIVDTPVQESALRWARRSDISGRGEGVSAQWDDDLEVHIRLGVMAASWGGEDRDAVYRAVLDAASRKLADRGEARRVGWHLLFGGLLRDDSEAMRLADAHAPMDEEEGRAVVEMLCARGESRRVCAWVLKAIDANPSWYPPGWLSLLSPRRNGGAPVWPTTLAFGARLSHHFPASCEIRLFRGTRTASLNLVKLDQRHEFWADVRRRAEGDDPVLVGWRAVADFHLEPGHERLANVLELLSLPACRKDLACARRTLSWPLAACVDFARHASEFDALSQAAREGLLGTIDEWKLAEQRWASNHSFDDTAWRAWLTPSDRPWDVDLLRVGAFLWGAVRWSDASKEAPFDQVGIAWLTRETVRALEVDGVRARRARLLIDALLDPGQWGRMISWEDVQGDLVSLRAATQLLDLKASDVGSAALVLDLSPPDFCGPEADAWLQLHDEKGRRASHAVGRSEAARGALLDRIHRALDRICDRIAKRPDQWGLLSAVGAILTALPNCDLGTLSLPEMSADITARGRANREFLGMFSSMPPEEFRARMGSLHLSVDGAPIDLRFALARILAHRTRDPERTGLLLLAALDSTTPDDRSRETLMGALLAHHRRTVAPAFVDEASWDQMKFASHFVGMEPSARSPQHLVSIDELVNFRLFREMPSVDTPFPTPGADQGQWVVIVGENGVGKSTLLRALALALAPPDDAAKLLSERLPLVRNGDEARVRITIPAGVFRATLRGGASEKLLPLAQEVPNRPWVVGYGVRRGDARSEEDRAVDWDPAGNLHTLFDRPAALVNARQWLLNLDRLVLREARTPASSQQPHKAMWDAVVRALATLLEIREVEPGDEHIFVVHPVFGKVRLDALSDGFLSVTGWVIDLIARWVKRQEYEGEPIGPDLLGQMVGFVFIDEIDLHLHPLWQMRIIESARRVFPRLTFIVTTHNPLTLHGAKRGEVYVMRREGERIELVQKNIQPGHDIDRVLLEQFGVEHTFDEKTRKLLRDHRRVVVNGAAPDDPERVSLEAQLRERLGHFGDTVREQRHGPGDPKRELSETQRANLARYGLKKKSGDA